MSFVKSFYKPTLLLESKAFVLDVPGACPTLQRIIPNTGKMPGAQSESFGLQAPAKWYLYSAPSQIELFKSLFLSESGFT